MNFLSPENKGAIYAIASGLFFGLVGYFGMNMIHANLSIPNMLFWRFFIGSLTVGIVLLGTIKTINVSNKELLQVFLYGAVFYTPSTIIYFSASKLIGTGLAMVIFFTFPAMIMLINWILHKTPITKQYYLAMGLITLGMVLLVNIQEFTFDIMGMGLGILAALFYAFYAIESKKITMPPLLSTLLVSLGCMVACFFGALATHSFIIPTTLSMWINIIAMGIICTALPILFFLESLKYISTEKASILSVLEPIFVVLFGVVLLNESVTLLQLLGIIVILAGAMVTLRDNTQH